MTRTNDRTKLYTLIALGANVGEPLRQLRDAVDRIGRFVEVDQISSVYRTEPVGRMDQPDFFNLVLGGWTEETIYGLHAATQAVEAGIGRIREERDGPRSIDVDLLSYGELVLVSERLTIPHPRMYLRSFVLAPLMQIAPEWRHPVLGTTAGDALVRLHSPSRVRELGALARVG